MVDDWFLEHVAKVTSLSCVLIVIYLFVYSVWRITRMPNNSWNNRHEWQWRLGGRHAVEIYRKATEMPFSLSLEENCVEDVNQITFTLSYLKEGPVPQVTVMWGPSVSYLMRIINGPWNVLNNELMISKMASGEWKSVLGSIRLNIDRSHFENEMLNYFILQRLEVPSFSTKTLSIGTSAYKSAKLVVTPPVAFDWNLLINELRYPAVIFVTAQSTRNDYSIHGIIEVAHIKNEVISKASSTLRQYIKMNNGQCHILQSLYVMDDHLPEEGEIIYDGECTLPFKDVLCSVCQSRPVGRVIIPCRHVCLCGECFRKVEFCPICRGAIIYYFKTRPELNSPMNQRVLQEPPAQLTWWQRIESWNERFSDATGLTRN